jgi:trehalose/maltose hydrolase-like predicted phosphorylase
VRAETNQSHVRTATALRTTVRGVGPAHPAVQVSENGRHAHQVDVLLHAEQPTVVDKTVAITTSREPAMASPELGALEELRRAPVGVAGLLPRHVAAWSRLWDRFAINLDAANAQSQLALNLHVFHLLQAVSPHTAGLDAGVPARGLHGEGYRGHVFWDELFVMPLVTAHLPAVARSLLEYRWRRLGAARSSAADLGLAGALFPWQSGSDGREETPRALFNTRSARWMPDNSWRQRHVGLAVAVNAWRYYQTTGDTDWLAARGAELIIEVARLFASLAGYDPAEDRFHIAGVMGPDEYHDGYPDSPGEGVRDNAYTNVLAAWVFGKARETLAVLAGHQWDDVAARLEVGPDELARWEHLGRRVTVPFHDGVISQFDGYEALAELDWAHYRREYGNIGRLDLILESEGDQTNRYKLAKQADVLMLVYVLGPDELRGQLGRLGYPFGPEALAATVEYYLARTAHGSTLSRVVHASVLARLDPTRAWAVFRDALVADLDDTQGGTTEEGIHLGAMAGTIDIVTRAFAGMQLHSDHLSFDPRLPESLHGVCFQVEFRGQRIDVALHHDRLRLTTHSCATASGVPVTVAGSPATLTGGGTWTFPLKASGHGGSAPSSSTSSTVR